MAIPAERIVRREIRHRRFVPHVSNEKGRPMFTTRYRRLFTTGLCALALGALSGGYAAAQTPSPEMQKQIRAVAAACRVDIRKYCGGIEPGGGRIAVCLGANEEKLAPGCRAAFDSVRPK